MGQLAYSTECRAARLVASISGMIQTSLSDAVTPLSVTIDSLAARITVYERGQGVTDEVTTLKAAIAALRRDVDQLKFTDMSMIFGMVEIPDVPVEPDMPATTTKDDVRVEEAADPESEVETDNEMIGVDDEASYEGLTETEEAMVDAAM
ncbi:uncharacterized protein LOC125842820 [Solanum stenotomum]|uniref:uncharacterized protein LOC125842820 n=1 Tax=Solanum stenotomum TaxID=172797 RepID=UPI0020D0FD50|nr:uncharacterized protein LOC125842820 [Solanum stenotomum]